MSAIDRALLVSLGLTPTTAAIVMTEIETLQIELKMENEHLEQMTMAANQLHAQHGALLSMVKMCYRKHVLGDDNIGWTQLEDYLLHALCNDMGDEGYQKWVEAAKENL